MKKWLALAAAVLIAGTLPALASNKKAAQKLLDSAHSPADLFQHATGPFDLEVDFTIHARKAIQGHMSLKWQSKSRWRRELTLGGFDEGTILDGENRYTWGPFSYTPERINQLYRLLHLKGEAPSIPGHKVKNQIAHGVKVSCVSGRDMQDYSAHISYKFCLDPQTDDILSIDTKQELPSRSAETFAGYVDFEGQRFPRQFERYENGVLVISARVVSLQQAQLDTALFVPPHGATHRRVCPYERLPKPVSTPSPKLPGLSRNPAGIGVHMTVQTDGSVSDVQLINSNDPTLNAAVIAAFKKWKFKPATCDGEPVVADFTTFLTVVTKRD